MLQVAPSLGEVIGIPELAAGPIGCIGSREELQPKRRGSSFNEKS